MGTTSLEEPGDEAATSGHVRFTRGGEAALDALADRLAAHAGDTPESIAQVLERILDADIADLAAGLTPATEDQHRPVAETPDQAARRRMGLRRDAPTEGGPAPSRPLDR